MKRRIMNLMKIRTDLQSACSRLGIRPGDSETDILRKRDHLIAKFDPKKIADRPSLARLTKLARYKVAGYKVAYKVISKADISEVHRNAGNWGVMDADTVVYGYEPSNEGALKWSVELDASVVLSPAVGDGLLFVPCTDKNLYALDVSEGTIKWRFHAGSEAPSSPCIAGRDVYFTTKGEYVFAIDCSIPCEKWRSEGIRPTGEMPVIFDGRLYIGTMDHRVVALDQGTGAIVSEWQTDARIIGVPRIIDGVLYFSTEKSLEWINLDSGLSQSWPAGGPREPRKPGEPPEPPQPSGRICSSPAGEGSIVCYATTHRQLHAVDVSKKREIWKIATSESFSLNPIVEKGTLISVMRETDLYGVELETGALSWRVKFDNLRDHSPAASEGEVFIGGGSGGVVGVESTTGQEILWFNTPGWPVTSPAIQGDTIFFGSEDKHVYAVTRKADPEDNTATGPN